MRACFAALERLAVRGADLRARIRLAADFRAPLHCGPVVVGELGYLKKEIALIGDTMTTAARILEACRETGYRVLASAALLEAPQLAAAVRRRGARARAVIDARQASARSGFMPWRQVGRPRPQPTSRKSFSSSVP